MTHIEYVANLQTFLMVYHPSFKDIVTIIGQYTIDPELFNR
jgi:hypothetical protein